MATSRFVCGEISRSIRPLRAPSLLRERNVRSREAMAKKPPRKHVSHSRMNARSVLTPVAPPAPLASSRADSPASRFALTPLSSWTFLPYQRNALTKKDDKEERRPEKPRDGDVVKERTR